MVAGTPKPTFSNSRFYDIIIIIKIYTKMYVYMCLYKYSVSVQSFQRLDEGNADEVLAAEARSCACASPMLLELQSKGEGCEIRC